MTYAAANINYSCLFLFPSHFFPRHILAVTEIRGHISGFCLPPPDTPPAPPRACYRAQHVVSIARKVQHLLLVVSSRVETYAQLTRFSRSWLATHVTLGLFLDERSCVQSVHAGRPDSVRQRGMIIRC